jgi:hypothetical protein
MSAVVAVRASRDAATAVARNPARVLLILELLVDSAACRVCNSRINFEAGARAAT